MTKFISEYYEKEITLYPEDKDILFNLYIKVSKNQGFKPEVSSPDEIDNTSFDHVAYHVEEFGRNLNGFEDIKHLFYKL